MIEQEIAAFEILAEKERKERSKLMFPTSMKVVGVRAPNSMKLVCRMVLL